MILIKQKKTCTLWESSSKQSFCIYKLFRKINEDNQDSIIFRVTFFELENVEGDGNYGYRALAFQIDENENFHYKIREDIYNYLKLNESNFSELNFQIALMLVTAKEYIEKVKEDGFWIIGLEMPAFNKIYESTLYVYEWGSDPNVYLL